MPSALHQHDWPCVGPAITGLHGWGGTGRDFEPLASAGGFHWRAVDLVGHGLSDAPEDLDAYGLEAQLHQLTSTMTPGGFLLGYSMGARLALHYALRRPDTLQGLILVSGTAGLEMESERTTRRAWDHEQAESLEEMGAPAFMTQWEQQPLLSTAARGIPRATYDHMMNRRREARSDALARSFRAFGTGTMPSAWEGLSLLPVPTLLVVGEKDPGYCRLAERMRNLIPQADLVTIPGAGHRPHLENGPIFQERLRHWMAGR